MAGRGQRPGRDLLSPHRIARSQPLGRAGGFDPFGSQSGNPRQAILQKHNAFGQT